MRILEIVLFALAIIALILKFLFVPGADEILMISLTLLSTLYFAFGLLVMNQIRLRAAFKGGLKNISAFKVIISVFAGMGLSTIWIGVLFKLLEFTGADDMLAIGDVFSGVMLLAWVISYFLYRDPASGYSIARLLGALVIGIFLLFTSEMTLVRWQYHDHPRYIQASDEYFKNRAVDSLQEKRTLEYYRARMPKDAFKKYEEEYNARPK